MTNDWNERRGLILGLGLIGAGVWGYTLYTFAGAAAPETTVSAAPAVSMASLAPHYEDLGRDPFEPALHLDPDLAGLTAAGPAPTAWGGQAPPPVAAPPEPTVREPASGEPGRRLSSASVPPPSPSAAPPTSTLVGVIGQSALLRTAAGQSVTVRVGDSVDGLEVADVGLDAIVLADGSTTYTLSL